MVTEEAASTGTAEEATAWGDTVRGYTSPGGQDASTLGLANEPQPGGGTDVWADLLETGEPGVAAPACMPACCTTWVRRTPRLPSPAPTCPMWPL